MKFSPTLDIIMNVRPQREGTYGDCHKNFQAVADLWNAYLKARPGGAAAPILATDVPVFMAFVKSARIATGTAHHDNYADAANYLILAGDMVAGEG